MIAVAIVAVLAALAVQGTRIYLASARTAEARNMVGAIGRAAVAAYERENATAADVEEGASAEAASRALCLSATKVPTTVPKGRTYQPRTKENQDFDTGTDTKGWRCLRFSVTEPIHYQYSYRKGASGLAAPSNPAKPSSRGFEAGAVGDLDGDGVVARFALTGDIDKKSTVLRVATAIYTEQETE